MTLAELAITTGTTPKWILNAQAALGRELPYNLATARQLSVARELQAAYGIPIPKAFAMALTAIRLSRTQPSPVVLPADRVAPVKLTIDVERILSAVHTRLSQAKTMHEPGRRGRRTRRVADPIAAAIDHGIDLTLLAANQRRSPAQRLRQLDAMQQFRQNVRRVSEP